MGPGTSLIQVMTDSEITSNWNHQALSKWFQSSEASFRWFWERERRETETDWLASNSAMMLLDLVCWVLSGGTHALSCHSVPSSDLQDTRNCKTVFSRLPCQLRPGFHLTTRGTILGRPSTSGSGSLWGRGRAWWAVQAPAQQPQGSKVSVAEPQQQCGASAGTGPDAVLRPNRRSSHSNPHEWTPEYSLCFALPACGAMAACCDDWALSRATCTILFFRPLPTLLHQVPAINPPLFEIQIGPKIGDHSGPMVVMDLLILWIIQ